MHLEFVTPSGVEIPDMLKPRIWEGLEHFNDVQVALLGICEHRGDPANEGCEEGPEAIRSSLFRLRNFPKVHIADAGNIMMGDTYSDTVYAVKQTLNRLLEHKIIPIVIGGDQTLLHAKELAYHQLYFPFINILQVDERFHLMEDDRPEFNRENYLMRMIRREPNLIFNFMQMGYQSYLVEEESLERVSRLDFEACRLGRVKEDMTEVEPMVRDCDLMAFNVAALSGYDGVGYHQPSPNGFTAEQACRIVRYAGLSDRLSSIGFFDYNPRFDKGAHTAQVIAQAIWYFIQGVSQRKRDYPIIDERNFNKYIVSSQEFGHDITFLKSKKSERWWIRIPEEHLKYKSHQLFPCSYRDYQLALKEEIPQRWWKAYHKML